MSAADKTLRCSHFSRKKERPIENKELIRKATIYDWSRNIAIYYNQQLIFR